MTKCQSEGFYSLLKTVLNYIWILKLYKRNHNNLEMAFNSFCETEMHVSIITLLVFVLTYLITGHFLKAQSSTDHSILLQKKRDILNKHCSEDFDFFMNS